MIESRIDAGLRRLARAEKRDLEDALDGLQDARDLLVRLREHRKRVGGSSRPNAWVQALDGVISGIEEDIAGEATEATDSRATKLELPSRAIVEAGRRR